MDDIKQIESVPKSATDKTRFDDCLKNALHFDIIFRIVIGVLLAVLTAHFASEQKQFDAIEYFNKVAISLKPVVNIVGSVALGLSLIALILKDLEHVSPNTWGYNTKWSWYGGFVRRLAGDLTLWLIGAFVSVLFVIVELTLVFLAAGRITPRDWEIVSSLFLAVSASTALVAFLNILVRRAEPPIAANKYFSKYITNVWEIVALYVFGLLESLALFQLSDAAAHVWRM